MEKYFQNSENLHVYGREGTENICEFMSEIHLFISLLFPEMRFHYVQELGLTYVAKADLELTIFLP